MKLICDPPRHAFLIHFVKDQHSYLFQRIESEQYFDVIVNPETNPMTLVSIEFRSGGIILPFINSNDTFSIGELLLHSGYQQNIYYFNFDSYNEPQNCFKWKVASGLTVLVSKPPPPIHSEYKSENRPVLHSLHVDTQILKVEIDLSEFVINFGWDNLHP